MAANVHAVIVGVESAQLQLHADNVRDGTVVLDGPSLVVAGSSNPPVAIRVVVVHQRCCLLREGLTSRVPVLEREELVENGIENPANSYASCSCLVTNDLHIGAWGLALLQALGRELHNFKINAILKVLLENNRTAALK